MDVLLRNNKKPLDGDIEGTFTFSADDIYDKERKACTNVRLMCNVGVVSDGSLYNAVSECVTSSNKTFGKPSGDETNADVRCGADVFDMVSMRAKIQPFIASQTADKSNLALNADHYVKSVNGFWFTARMNGFTNTRSSTKEPCKFNRNNYQSFDDAYRGKLVRENGWYGFKNPVSLKVSGTNLVDYKKNKGMLNDSPGSFISLFPDKSYYTYAPSYNKRTKNIEYNWLTYITYPYENVYDTDFLTKISDNTDNIGLKRYGLTIWHVDEEDSEISCFRTKLRNGFTVGDIVNIYSGSTLIVNSREVVDKPDDYSFGIRMDEWKLLSWTYTVDDIAEDEDVSAYEVYYDNDGRKIYKTYIAPDDDHTIKRKMEAAYSPMTLNVVRVENQVECSYYIRKFKAIDKKPVIKANSFAKNAYGMDQASVMFIDDIDISKYTDNLGRTVSDIFFTSIKNNKGYSTWYGLEGKTYKDSNVNCEMSCVFGPVNGSFVMDDEVTNPYESIDTVHKNSIQNLTKYNGINVLTDSGNCEVNDGVFYGDLCEYSSSVFDERILQNFMHRFNTAQRDISMSDNQNIRNKLKVYNNTPVFSDSQNTNIRYGSLLQSVSSENVTVLNQTNGYYYQPHQRIRVKTYGLDLSYTDAVKYKVVVSNTMPNSEVVITYGNESSSGHCAYLTVESIDNIGLNTKIMLYYMSDSTDVNDDRIFEGRLVTKIDDTLYQFMVDEKYLEFNTCVNKNSGSFFILIRPSDAPSHAKLANDRSFRYVWRELYQNGYDYDSSVETYPFTNNAFYIDRNINIYLRRQRDVIHEDMFHEIYPSTGDNFDYLPDSEKIWLIDNTDEQDWEEIQGC